MITLNDCARSLPDRLRYLAQELNSGQTIYRTLDKPPIIARIQAIAADLDTHIRTLKTP